jgi:hypothetical protein
MNEGKLHIVSFNIPFPANYGGVIDVYYKLEALSEIGVKLALHTFEYGRKHAPELNRICESVYYYKRKKGFLSQFSLKPYIVYSRRNKRLLEALLQEDAPILFEGLHSCYLLNHPKLKNRMKLVRIHNIEYLYYLGLACNSRSLLGKAYFRIESWRLKRFERILNHADKLLTLSTTEYDYYTARFGKEKTLNVPLFFNSHSFVRSTGENTDPYVLFHGDLSTSENDQAARFLIQEVASLDSSIQWIFAGMNPAGSLHRLSEWYGNVCILPNPDETEMAELIGNATVHMLYTTQISGVKLKLLHAMASGKPCVANKKMVDGSGLESLCKIVSDQPEEILTAIRQSLEEEMPENEVLKRKEFFHEMYDNHENALIISNLL